MKQVLLITIAIATALVSATSSALISKAIPGGVVTLEVNAKERPSATYNDRPVMIQKVKGNIWKAVVGLPLWIKPGEHSLKFDDGQVVNFIVQSHQYPEQRITLKTNKHVNLSQEDLARHKKEKAKAIKAFKHFEDQPAPLDFIKPTKGPYSSAFGLKRFFNDQPRNPHSGIDIAAPKGTPIVAPAPGKVVLTGNFFFNGNVVYIDHGQGLITMFCHMDSIDVKEGMELKTGDLVGKVGATGRVTGPHLHWSLSLNNTRVNPKLFMNEIE